MRKNSTTAITALKRKPARALKAKVLEPSAKKSERPSPKDSRMKATSRGNRVPSQLPLDSRNARPGISVYREDEENVEFPTDGGALPI